MARRASLAFSALLTTVTVPAVAQVAGTVGAAEPGARTAYGRQVTGYFAASYGAARAGEDEYTWGWSVPVNEGGGQSTSRTTYGLPRGESFSIGGGALFGAWGAGVLATQQSHQDPADCAEFFSTTALPEGFAGSEQTAFDLERRERALHLHGVWAPYAGEAFQAVVFAGPTYFFDVTQETIDFVDVELVEPGVLRPLPFPPGEQQVSTWGYHVGADLALLLTSRFGVGLSLLYSDGTAELRDRYAEEMLTNADVVEREQEVGGIQLAIGLRARL